jgi:hypothetical protein
VQEMRVGKGLTRLLPDLSAEAITATERWGRARPRLFRNSLMKATRPVTRGSTRC